jgi:pimeloyl-ACP methyl ester carboxylesterase
MPFALNLDGTNIHYEVIGEGPPLVLQHGLLSDLGSWQRRGYVDALKNSFQLILIDSRGHGESDKPKEAEAYELRTRVTDLATVLNVLKINKAHYMGYSMGGWMGYGIAIYMPQRFKSLIIGGFGPFRAGRFDGPLTEDQRKARWEEFRDRTISDPDRARALKEFPWAMKHCKNALDTWRGARQALKTGDLPLLLFSGTKEPNSSPIDMPEVLKFRPDAEFFSVEGTNHIETIEAVDTVAPRVLKFLEKVEGN